MKKNLAVFITCSFVAIAVFGVFAMNHGESSHGRCIAETAAGADCPQNNIFATANFLLNVFKSFSTANLISIIFLALVASLMGFCIPMTVKDIAAMHHLILERSFKRSYPTKFQLARLRILYEKRDPALSF